MNEQNVGVSPSEFLTKDSKLDILSNKGYYLKQMKQSLELLSANPPQINNIGFDQFRQIATCIHNFEMQDCADMVHLLVVGCLKKKCDALEKELHDLIK